LKGLWIIEPSEARCARLSMPVCAACHPASYRTVSSCCVFACIDRQASLDEDALEMLAIQEAQERARDAARAVEVAAKRQKKQEAPVVRPDAPKEPVAAPKSAPSGVMARWLARGSAQSDAP
jgi:hypothetical protein